ncbi:MAG: peroxide stress protein YaaA [Myxococcota bacterium]
MLVLLSPAKRLHEGPALADFPGTSRRLGDASDALIGVVKTLEATDLRALMHISQDLADLNVGRFEALTTHDQPDGARQALFLFDGDVYRGLDAASLSSETVAWAQDHLRILSGLYGVVRPLDLVQPYRLEMGTKLQNPGGANLYRYWGTTIADALMADSAGHADDTIVNLASTEYSRAALVKKALTRRVVTPVFKEVKDGKSRVISFLAKVSRGRMARWILEERVSTVAQLRTYAGDGYVLNEAESTEDRWVFERPQPPPVAEQRRQQGR